MPVQVIARAAHPLPTVPDGANPALTRLSGFGIDLAGGGEIERPLTRLHWLRSVSNSSIVARLASPTNFLRISHICIPLNFGSA